MVSQLSFSDFASICAKSQKLQREEDDESERGKGKWGGWHNQ